jgi:hypothetical protein
MSKTTMPLPEGPFTVTVDGKVERRVHRWEEMQALVNHLRRQHPGSPDRVQAFDRWEQRVDGRPLGD